MKRLLPLLTIGLALLMAVSCASTAGRSSTETVKASMGRMLDAYNKLVPAVEALDYAAATAAFAAIAEEAEAVRDIPAAQGKADNWAEVQTSLLEAAMRGRIAASVKVEEAVKEAFGEVKAAHAKAREML